MSATAVAPIEEDVFNAASYDLPIPELDGFTAVELELRFSGSGKLDRTSTDDLALLEAARLGHEVLLLVRGEINGKGFRLARKTRRRRAARLHLQSEGAQRRGCGGRLGFVRALREARCDLGSAGASVRSQRERSSQRSAAFSYFGESRSAYKWTSWSGLRLRPSRALGARSLGEKRTCAFGCAVTNICSHDLDACLPRPSLAQLSAR